MFNIIKYTLLEISRGRLYLISLAVIAATAGLSRVAAQINDIFGNLTPATFAFGMFFTKAVAFVFLVAAPVFSLSAEVESGAIQFSLARTARRSTYLLAKYAAYLTLYAGLLLLSALALGGVTLLFESAKLPELLRGLGLFVFSELLSGAMLLAILFALYAAIRAPIATAVLTVMAFFVSLMLDAAKSMAATTPNPVVKLFYLLLYYGYPGFRHFNLERPIIHLEPVAPVYLAVLFAYAAGVSGVLLVAACRLFRRREF